jgi:hypothetical protein
MRNVVLIIVLLVLLVVAGGFLALGAFPPEPRSEVIQKIIPNERFAPPKT